MNTGNKQLGMLVYPTQATRVNLGMTNVLTKAGGSFTRGSRAWVTEKASFYADGVASAAESIRWAAEMTRK